MTKIKDTTEVKQSGKGKWTYVGLSLCLVLLGLFSILWPDIQIATICIAIGAAAVVFGIISIIFYFLTELKGVALRYDFSLGLLAVVGGIVLLIHPQGVLDALQIIIGVFLLVDSVLKLQTALDSRRIGIAGWWLPLVFCVICAALGGLMMIKKGLLLITTLIGVALLADGLQNLCLVIFSGIAERKLRRVDTDGDGVADAIEVTDDDVPTEEPETKPEPEVDAEPDPAPVTVIPAAPAAENKEETV